MGPARSQSIDKSIKRMQYTCTMTFYTGESKNKITIVARK